MCFRDMVRFVLLAKKCGWYTVRQAMIKQGYTLDNMVQVLANLLRLQGSEVKKV